MVEAVGYIGKIGMLIASIPIIIYNTPLNSFLMSHTTDEIWFKFRFVNDGRAAGFFAQKGLATERLILLGKNHVIYYDSITDTLARDRRLVIAISTTPNLNQQAANYSVVVEVYGVKASKLKRYIDVLASRKEVENRKQQLLQSGHYHYFRGANCPECQASIDLSDFDRASYIYCRFCESIFKEQQPAITKGEKYRGCDECRMFDRVRGYTEFYFYLLIAVYGFSYKRRHVCDNCADAIFWKTLFLNLLFVVGIIPSIYIKIKSITGRDRSLKTLARANSLAKKGNYQKAAPIYSQLYQEYSEHPGLLMSEGLGHLIGNDGTGAVNCFTRSLKSCSNYYPAMRLLQQLQAANK